MKVNISEVKPRNQVKEDKRKGIFNNGIDNCYPQRVEAVINASVTAKAATDMLCKFIIGDGFIDPVNDIIVNKGIVGDTTLFKLHSQVARTISRHFAACIQVRYDLNGMIPEVQHIPYRNVRFGQKDSNDYSGILHVCPDWANRNIKDGEIMKVNSFNPRADVVVAQFAKYGKNYNGQLSVLRLDDEYIYPLSPIDPAIEDADTESQIKMFKNTELSKGFFAKYILWHTGFENDGELQDFKTTLRKFESGDHQSSILMAEGAFDSEGRFIDNSNFRLEKIEQNINDKLFESYEKTIANNIRKALLCIPSILIEQQDGAFFGTSAEAFRQAFDFYNTQTADIRAQISQWYASIFKYSTDEVLKTANFTIKKLSYGTVDAGGTATN